MIVSETGNGTSASAAAAYSSAVQKKDQLGQKEFLQLMIAQLKNQDPFKAMDPSQFLGQLAQFGTVSGIQEMQNALAALSAALRSSQVLDGAALIGREVLVASDEVMLATEDPVRCVIDVPENATSVSIQISDASGQLVRRITVSNVAGLTEIEWDGVSDAGTRAPPGKYSFEAVANVGGASTSLEILMASRVSSVTVDAGRGLILNTSTLGSRSLGDVRRVM
ncbi:MAG: flagellar hook capping FlgD N-terminal domain-containing protein [Gammaproteobacteria bacterium]|nr:flagellar hook capping protein [Gammaproteobacteria bacterium]